MIEKMAISDQIIWSAKENQAFLGKRPIAMSVPAIKLRD